MPISSPSALSKEVYGRAERIAGALDGMEIKYPLVRADLALILCTRNGMTRPETSVRLSYQPSPLPTSQHIALLNVLNRAASSLRIKPWESRAYHPKLLVFLHSLVGT
jgi:hypothetical protein